MADLPVAAGGAAPAAAALFLLPGQQQDGQREENDEGEDGDVFHGVGLLFVSSISQRGTCRKTFTKPELASPCRGEVAEHSEVGGGHFGAILIVVHIDPLSQLR